MEEVLIKNIKHNPNIIKFIDYVKSQEEVTELCIFGGAIYSDDPRDIDMVIVYKKHYDLDYEKWLTIIKELSKGISLDMKFTPEADYIPDWVETITPTGIDHETFCGKGFFDGIVTIYRK